MSSFIKEMVKMKIRQLSHQDLLNYSKEYNFSLTEMQSRSIIAYLQTNNLDPFLESDRVKMFNKLAEITDHATASKTIRLFNELISSYGLEYLFK